MRLLFTDTDSVMVQIFELQDPLHAMAEANLNGAALFDVAGKSKHAERDLSALSAAARAKAIEVMGQLGKLGDETFPARTVTNVRRLEYREVLEEGSERRAAFAQLRSAPQAPFFGAKSAPNGRVRGVRFSCRTASGMPKPPNSQVFGGKRAPDDHFAQFSTFGPEKRRIPARRACHRLSPPMSPVSNTSARRACHH